MQRTLFVMSPASSGYEMAYNESRILTFPIPQEIQSLIVFFML